jgi:two-component system, cell cycle response regulator
MSDDIQIESIRSEIVSLLGGTDAVGRKPDENAHTGRGAAYSFSKLLKELVHSNFGEEEAREHWKNILVNYTAMKNSLSRDIGIRIAAYDYFLNSSEQFKHTLLVDHSFIRKLRHGALVDPLTGAYNRSYFELHLKKELKRAIRHNRLFSLLLIDFDDFNMLNQTRGQDFCDDIIVHMVKLLRDTSREEDLLCRFGLGEFIFFLPETNAEGAFHFAERVMYKIMEDRMFADNNVSVSGGIAEYPTDSRNIFNLIKCADSALYHAKAKGKDKVSFYKERNELSSIYDNLTGLFNYAHFESLLAKEHARAVRHNLKYSLLHFDIDQFNKVNDDEGAVFGDLALTQFACLLSSKCRELDILARIGGGQFAFLLPETDSVSATTFAERLRESIVDKCGFNNCRFTFSCGIASYPFDGFDAREIADLARTACNQAKKEGGNKIVRCTHNRRASKRYKKTISLKYKLLESAFSDPKHHDLLTEDLSLRGMRCTGNDEIPLESPIILLFKSRNGKEQNLIILAKVVWCRQEGRSRFTYGIEFQEADEAKTARLKEIIKSDERECVQK